MIRARAIRSGVSAFALTLSLAAAAKDLPADDAGAKTVQSFISAYFGEAANASSNVTPAGDAYKVVFDVGAATRSLQNMGFVYDAAQIAASAFRQDDGQWRVEQHGLPPFSGHLLRHDPNGDIRIDTKVDVTNFESKIFLDPKLGWVASGEGKGDEMTIVQSGPGVDQHMRFGKLSFDVATKSGPNGLTTTINQPIVDASLAMHVDPPAVHPPTAHAPVDFHAAAQNAVVRISLQDFQPAPLAELLSFFANHPDRPSYARDAAAFRAKVDALLADHLTIDESFGTETLTFITGSGPVVIQGGAFGATLLNNGDDSAVGEHLAAHDLKFPNGMIPPPFEALAPASIDLTVRATGFDAPSAVAEWFADANWEGDGPVVTKADQQKVWAKLVGGRPIRIAIGPARVVGPNLDLAFEGAVTVDSGVPSGVVTITARNFEKTTQAVTALGLDIQQKAVPVIAMAKGLAKSGPDGSLVWKTEMGADGVIKVNGLPLGKAPKSAPPRPPAAAPAPSAPN